MSDWQLRPARDLGQAPNARLKSLARERGLGSVLLREAWRGLVGTYLTLAHRPVIEGRENLPAKPPYVLIANHSSHMDTLLLGHVLQGAAAREAHALAAGEVFFGSDKAAIFAAYAINALPVWRKQTKGSDLALMRARLAEDGLVYILFPEGTRARDGVMAPFKPGIGTLVAGTGIPVVPCALEGCHAAWPADATWPRPGRLRVRIGAPLRFDEVANQPRGWVTVAQRCEDAVRALMP